MQIEHRWARVMGPAYAFQLAEHAARVSENARNGRMRVLVRALQAVGTCPQHLPAASALLFMRTGVDRYVN